MAHEKSIFSSGDQDYDSAIGWTPGVSEPAKKGSISERLIEEDKKRNPRAYAKRPEMLFSLPMKYWLGIGVGLEPAQQLFGPFWNRGELAIMYGAAGVGKSALATQIAESLARGLRIPPFSTDATPAEPEKVLYLDFELSTQQLAPRYSILDSARGTYDLAYDFSENLTRSILSWNGGIIEGYEDFSDMFFTSLSDTVDSTAATVVIIDNITFLDENTTSNTSTALSIMQSLNRLKRSSEVSILVLAHTRKRRPWEELTGRDLQGSVNLANFADSLFALGQSRIDRQWRYAKQIKTRSGPLELDEKNVALFSLTKYDAAAKLGLTQNTERPSIDNFLGYEFLRFENEDRHVDTPPRPLAPKKKREWKKSDAKRLAAEGKSAREIAERLGIPKSTAHR